MTPKKLKLVTLVSMGISAFYMFILFAFSIMTDSNITMYLYIIAVLGWIMVLMGSYIMMKGHKNGYYMFVVGFLLNIAVIFEILVMVSFLWFLYGLYVILTDQETHVYLKLNDSTLENPFKKKIVPTHSSDVHVDNHEQQIIDYVKQTEAKGYTDAQVKQALLGAGYDKVLIDDAINKARNSVMT
jgi:hypothetical protein